MTMTMTMIAPAGDLFLRTGRRSAHFGAAAGAAGAAGLVYFVTRSTVRLFLARPDAVMLTATGLLAPKPTALMRSGPTPLLSR